MRAIQYDRVSTDEQAKEGYSIETQHTLNTKFIESQGWTLIDSYVDDGYSAKNLKRPEMQRLIEDAKAKRFDVVVFYKLDRLVRSVSDLNELLKLFDANKIGIRSVTEPFDTTTAMGRFLITLVAAIAEWERETISERVFVTMQQKAKKGERNGGKPPYGYKLVDGVLNILEEEAKVVREIFRLYNAGKGVRSIGLYIQQFGVQKDIRTITRMLDNPVYAGKLRWGNNSKMDTIVVEENTHPAIINIETFEYTQYLRNKRTTEGKKATSPYHFSGVLRCARCGSPLSGYYKKVRDTKHYICIGKKNKGTCDLPMFTEKALTSKFLEELIADDTEKFLSTQYDLSTDEIDNTETLIKELEKELTTIKSRKKNWLNALGNGIISQEEYLEMTSEDTKKEKLLKEQLEEIPKQKPTIEKDTLLSLLRSIPDMWEIANDFEKKNFINDLFETITVNVPSSYYRAPGKTPSVEISGVTLK